MKPVSFAETVSRTYCGFQVFFGRKEALARFGNDSAAFVESFWPALLLFPLHLFISFVIDPDPRIHHAPFGVRLATDTIEYVIGWVYWPLAMAYISLRLKHPENWIRYVVATNWTIVTPILIYSLLAVMTGAQWGTLSQGLLIGMQVWLFLIHGWILQTLFRTSLGATIALVVAELFITLFLSDVRVWITLNHTPLG